MVTEQIQQHGEGKVMADCETLSQHGDKGSPDGRPFTLDLCSLTIHQLKPLLSCKPKQGVFNVFRTPRARHTLTDEAPVDKILSQRPQCGGILLLLMQHWLSCRVGYNWLHGEIIVLRETDYMIRKCLVITGLFYNLDVFSAICAEIIYISCATHLSP